MIETGVSTIVGIGLAIEWREYVSERTFECAHQTLEVVEGVRQRARSLHQTTQHAHATYGVEFGRCTSVDSVAQLYLFYVWVELLPHSACAARNILTSRAELWYTTVLP